jgi:SAM-dependent methyltransferase
MWPALGHGQSFHVHALGAGEAPQVGEAVLACPGGIPDLLRVVARFPRDLRLAADADPGAPCVVTHDEVIGRALLPPARPRTRTGRWLRRLLLDQREAWTGRAAAGADAAQSVRDKYEAQAPFYAHAASAADLDPRLLERVRQAVSPPGRILVVGSGTGRECFALAAAGYDVLGIDFSPAMVSEAARECARRGLSPSFDCADIRELTLPDHSLAAALFTYDVYSFLPGSGARRDVLRRIRSWLAPTGRLFLSARRVRSAYERAILSEQWLSRRGDCEWGASHTRWIGPDGTLHRAFVQLLTERSLAAEAHAAGFRILCWEGGHGLLQPLIP